MAGAQGDDPAPAGDLSMTEPPATVPLSETELEILRQLATGATNREIAHDRGISEATVKKHVTNINAKLGTANRTEALRRAIELGLVHVAGPEPAASSAHSDMVRQLVGELARTRQHSRRATRLWLLASLTVLVVVTVLAYTAVRRQTRATAGQTVEPQATLASGTVWVSGLDLPTPRSGLALVADGTQLYAIGGRDARAVLSQVLRYEPTGPRWRPRAAKPTAVTDAAAVMVQGKVVVPGGCDASGQALAVVELYDPQSDRWSVGAPLPEPRCGYALVALEGQVYLFGGRRSDDVATASAAVYRYDPTADQWQGLDPMPLPRADLAAVAVTASRIHVLGGRDVAGQLQTSHWSFQPYAEGSWNTEAGPPLPEGRAGLAAAALLDRIYVVGGGWDHRLADGAVVWDRASGASHWERFADVRGATPQRGAAMTSSADQWLHLAGGEADGRLLAAMQSVQVVWRILLPLR